MDDFLDYVDYDTLVNNQTTTQLSNMTPVSNTQPSQSQFPMDTQVTNSPPVIDTQLPKSDPKTPAYTIIINMANSLVILNDSKHSGNNHSQQTNVNALEQCFNVN
jgi:hypothetical protein